MSFKHLTHSERIIIEDRLNHNLSIRSIANELNKSPSTIQREIQNNQIKKKGSQTCAIRKNCAHKGLCGQTDCNNLCYKCMTVNCEKYCPDYVYLKCEKLESSPYVCNGCSKGVYCRLDECWYKGSDAQKMSQRNLVESRSGFDVTAEQLKVIDEKVSPLLKKGLSPYHIVNSCQLPVCESTLRRMINNGVLEARNIDLRDKVKRKERKTTCNKDRLARLNISKIGHLYSDYKEYVKETESLTVEMDCVEGSKDDNTVLLTLTWKETSLQLAFIMESQISDEVIRVLDMIEEILGKELFAQMFPLILTDNGHEFSDITGIERSNYGGQRTKVYFCEPNRSDQKGTCENHHRMIRFFIPKGTPLCNFRQEQINMMMNNINSYSRKALFGKSAYAFARNIFPEDFFIMLGLEEIPAEDIVLNKSIFSSQ